MKKRYIAPAADLLAVKSQEMLAVSLPISEETVNDVYSQESDGYGDWSF